MKRLRRLAFLIALVVTLICIVLLLNFTAANPTGRRYSSAPVQTSGGAANIGLSGERILSQDLRTPRNDDPDQRQCICNDATSRRNPGLSECRVCIAYSQSVATYRRPDFIGANFIAESKNRQDLPYTYSDLVEQIGDYAVAAKAMSKPLWVYVRVNTNLDPEYTRLVEATGGGIVPYFTVPGYVDPVDQAAGKVLPVAAIVVIITGVWELGARRVGSPRAPKNPVAQPHRKTASAEGFVKAAKDHAQHKIDVEDSRQDDPK